MGFLQTKKGVTESRLGTLTSRSHGKQTLGTETSQGQRKGDEATEFQGDPSAGVKESSQRTERNQETDRKNSEKIDS